MAYNFIGCERDRLPEGHREWFTPDVIALCLLVCSSRKIEGGLSKERGAQVITRGKVLTAPPSPGSAKGLRGFHGGVVVVRAVFAGWPGSGRG